MADWSSPQTCSNVFTFSRTLGRRMLEFMLGMNAQKHRNTVCFFCCLQTLMHNMDYNIHAYIHTYIHTFIHSYIRTYVRTHMWSVRSSKYNGAETKLGQPFFMRERMCVKQRVSAGPVVNDEQAVRTWLQDYSGNNVSGLAVPFLGLWAFEVPMLFLIVSPIRISFALFDQCDWQS